MASETFVLNDDDHYTLGIALDIAMPLKKQHAIALQTPVSPLSASIEIRRFARP